MNSKGWPRSARTTPRHVAWASVAALAAAGASACLPYPSSVKAVAIVAVDEPSAALRLAAARGGADLVASTPVMSRAAASLIGTDVSPPEASGLERLGVALGLARARGATARLGDRLEGAVAAQAGDGLVEIGAVSTDAATASRYATAVAEALVTEEDIAATAALRRREAAASDRLDGLRAAAHAARERLAGLGASEADPADALVAAATTTRAAEEHLAAVRAVIAAGTPPLGAGSDLPAATAALQQTYWDLRKQLDKASETLGERHTTVVALRDGVARASATLTSEWQKIERAAVAAAGVARGREAVLRRTAANPDAGKQAAIDEARRALRRATAALAAPPAAAPPAAAPFRLVSVSVPAGSGALPVGRLLLAALAAGAVFALVLLPRSRRRSRPLAGDTGVVHEPVPARVVHAFATVAAAEPETHAATAEAEIARGDDRPVPPDADLPEFVAVAREEAAEPMPEIDDAEPEPIDLPVDVPPAPDDSTVPMLPPAVHDLRDALRAVAAALDGTDCAVPGLPSVLVAANAAGADTGGVALAFGEVAAELGFRVLLIETERSTPTLAAAVAPDGEPLLVDTFDALRVVLPSDTVAGLFLAPALREGARIAAALARNTQAAIIDDLPAAFDLLVVDGGSASDATAGGWSADRYLRVGSVPSPGEDERFLATFGATDRALFGTVANGRFVAFEPAAAVERREAPALADMRPRLRGSLGGDGRRRATMPGGPVRSVPRRRAVAR